MEIQILLSVYNGERYLPEQLASLDSQRDAPEWELLWRDDGSTDSSVTLLKGHSHAARLENGSPHLGPGVSFLRLLRGACDDARAFAFCDQDDVWLPYKLARAWAWISAQPAELPALYCSRQHIVDELLRPTGLSPAFRRPLGFRNALVQNVATGCTIMLNPAARRLILAAPPPPATSLHDWWCYLLVSGAGGRLLGDPAPTLLYRQHGHNSVGATESAMARGLRAVRRGPFKFTASFEENLVALQAAGPLLTQEAQDIIVRLRNLCTHSPLGRLRRLSAARVYRQGILEDLALRCFFLFAPRKTGQPISGLCRP